MNLRILAEPSSHVVYLHRIEKVDSSLLEDDTNIVISDVQARALDDVCKYEVEQCDECFPASEL